MKLWRQEPGGRSVGPAWRSSWRYWTRRSSSSRFPAFAEVFRMFRRRIDWRVNGATRCFAPAPNSSPRWKRRAFFGFFVRNVKSEGPASLRLESRARLIAMKSRGKYHLASLLVIIALVPLVVLLAALQYKWLGQISESEREKKHITLQKDAQRFGEDFDQEITRAYLYFQSNGDDFNRNNLGNFSEYYDRWVNQTPHPQLVSNIWLVTMKVKKAVVSLRSLENTGPVAFSEALPSAVVGSKMAPTVLLLRDEKRAGPVHPRGKSGAIVFTSGGYVGSGIHVNTDVNRGSIGLDTLQAFHISHFNRETGRFEATDWPAELERLRQRLETERKKRSPGASNPSYKFVVVALNINYIKNELIPALARRYFADGSAEGGLEYNLSIISRLNPHSPIFATDPQAAKDAAA